MSKRPDDGCVGDRVATAKVSAAAIRRHAGGGSVRVAASITNSGDRAGTEVVQCYIHLGGTSVARPVCELQGLERVRLAPGETRWVEFTLAWEELSFWDIEMRRRVELATLDIWGAPPGAEVRVDGHLIGSLPLPASVRVVSGRHAVAVEAAGFLPDRRNVDVTAGDLVREHVALGTTDASGLVAIPVARGPDVSGSGAAVMPTTSAVALPPTMDMTAHDSEALPEPPPQPDSVYRQWWFWTGAGAFVVGAAVTAFLVIRSEGRGCRSMSGTTCVGW